MKDQTLSTLIAVSKARPKMRRLVCPVDDCRGAVELKGGACVCQSGHVTLELKDLVVEREVVG